MTGLIESLEEFILEEWADGVSHNSAGHVDSWFGHVIVCDVNEALAGRFKVEPGYWTLTTATSGLTFLEGPWTLGEVDSLVKQADSYFDEGDV